VVAFSGSSGKGEMGLIFPKIGSNRFFHGQADDNQIWGLIFEFCRTLSVGFNISGSEFITATTQSPSPYKLPAIWKITCSSENISLHFIRTFSSSAEKLPYSS